MNRQVWGLSILFGTLALIQAIGEPTNGLAAQPCCSLLRAWGSDASGIATFVAALSLPWCVKPLYGLLTDFVPLAGYRRKSYLVVAAVATTLFFGSLYVLPFSAQKHNLFFVVLFLVGVAIAISDVVLDALVIETGQSMGMTGRLQSVSLGAAYAASLLTGVCGGVLSEEHQQQLSFIACAVLTAGMVILAIVYVREPQNTAPLFDGQSARKTIVDLLCRPSFWTVGGFLFAWHFNPFTYTVLYVHVTGPLAFSEKAYGYSMSSFSVGSIAACATYGIYCRRCTMKRMLPGSIVLGAASTLVYWPLTAGCDLTRFSLVAGFCYMTATLILMDLAARACPAHAAGTVFACWMALCNIGSGLSTWVGGWCYDAATAHWDSATAFSALLTLATVCMLGSWLIARRLPSNLLG
jgi:MFS family permease